MIKGLSLKLTKNEFLSLVVMFLMFLTGLGALINNGVFAISKTINFNFILFSTIIFLYISSISILNELGLKLNKFELFFLPSSIILILFVILYYINEISLILSNPPNSNVTTIPSSENIIDQTSSISENSQTTENTITDTASDENETSSVNRENSIFLGVISIFTFIIILIYAIQRLKTNFTSDIKIKSYKEYSKSKFKTNRTIIYYYLLSSQLIEEFKGSVPFWFTPTHFSHKVNRDFGSPLSNYFDILTVYYERARFGGYEMGDDIVNESIDLYRQIKNSLKYLKSKFINELEVNN